MFSCDSSWRQRFVYVQWNAITWWISLGKRHLSEFAEMYRTNNLFLRRRDRSIETCWWESSYQLLSGQGVLCYCKWCKSELDVYEDWHVIDNSRGKITRLFIKALIKRWSWFRLPVDIAFSLFEPLWWSTAPWPPSCTDWREGKWNIQSTFSLERDSR